MIWVRPTQEKYSRPFLKIIVFSTPSDIFSKTIPNLSENVPKALPDTSQDTPKSTKQLPQNDLRGPGIEPTTSRFQVRGPTHWGILASQNCSSGGFLCIKNTKSVRQISRMRTCALFFPCQNSARPSFSAAKIARPRFFPRPK